MTSGRTCGPTTRSTPRSWRWPTCSRPASSASPVRERARRVRGGRRRQRHAPLLRPPVRVEHWANALNQGLAAARNMLGRAEPYDRIPYFFSDQYDVGMEYSGLASGSDRVVFRGDPASRELIAFWIADGRVAAGMNVRLGRGRVDPGPDPLAGAGRPGPAGRPGGAARGAAAGPRDDLTDHARLWAGTSPIRPWSSAARSVQVRACGCRSHTVMIARTPAAGPAAPLALAGP